MVMTSILVTEKEYFNLEEYKNGWHPYNLKKLIRVDRYAIYSPGSALFETLILEP